MSYQKQFFEPGEILEAEELNYIEDGVAQNAENFNQLIGSVTKIQNVLGISDGEIEQVDKLIKPTKHVPKDLLNIPQKKVFVQAAKYAYALYEIDPAITYYVTGSAHSNAAEYPVGGFYDANDSLISMFGTTPNEVYTKEPVVPPENAVTMAVNKTIQTQSIEVFIKKTLTGSEQIDDLAEQTEEVVSKVDDFQEQYEKDNTPAIGPAVTPESTVENQIYNVVTMSPYGNEVHYGHSFYNVTGGKQYFVTCTSATNVDNFPGGAFYDADGNLLITICADPLTRYFDVQVKAPANAEKLVLNKNAGLPAAICKVGIESAEKSASSKSYDLGMASSLIALNNQNPFTLKALDKGYISFVFDDLTDDIDSIAATFEEYQMPLCLAAIPEKLDNIATGVQETRGSYEPSMSMRTIAKKVVELGGEVMAHNVDVITEKNQYDYEFMYDHVINCKNSLQAAGFTPRGFIRAGGEGAISNSPEIEKWLIGNFDYSNQGVSFRYSQERVTINQSIDTIKSIIDECASNKTWIRFMCHGYEYGAGDTFENETVQREILDYLQTKEIAVVTYETMIDMFGSTDIEQTVEDLSEGITPIIEEKLTMLTPTQVVDGSIYMIPSNEPYGDNVLYSHAFFDVKENERYYVSGSTPSNGSVYALCAFWNGISTWRLAVFGTDNSTAYKDFEVIAPAGAVKMVVNNCLSGSEIAVKQKTTLEERLDMMQESIAVVGSMNERVTNNESRINRGFFPVMIDSVLLEAKKNPFAFKPLDKGYVSFVFDDLRDTVDSIAAVFEEFNMPLCLAAIHTRMGVHATGLSAERGSYVPDMMMYEICFKVLELGGEIMAHCSTVINKDNQYDYDFMYDHFITTKEKFEAWGIDTRGMVRAGGADQISKSKEITRWVNGTYEYSNYSDEVNHDLQRETLNQPIDSVKALIKDAVDNKKWIRLMGHDYDYGNGETFTGEDDLREIQSYCQEQGIEVVTYGYMFDTFRSSKIELLIDS